MWFLDDEEGEIGKGSSIQGWIYNYAGFQLFRLDFIEIHVYL